MSSNLKEDAKLGNDWDFWLNSSKNEAESLIPKKRENYYFLFDCVDNKLDYVSESIYDVLGYKKEEFDIIKLFEIIHPEDLDYCNKCEFKTMQLCMHILHKELFKYKISYSYRVKTAFNEYITIRQDYKFVETDEYGRMFKSFVQHEKIENYTLRSDDDYEIYDKFKKRPVNFEKKYKLTKREIEILELVEKGFQTKDISDKLCLSEHTVKTHRKNILSKTESSSFLEALQKTGI